MFQAGAIMMSNSAGAATGVRVERAAHNQALTDLLDGLARSGRVEGGLVGIATPSATSIHAFGFVSTREGSRPPQRDDRFLLTSVTKPFVAMLVLSGVERGWFTLETPVAELVPEFGAEGKQDVTLAQILEHTSGLDDSRANTTEGPPSSLDAADHLAAACAAPLRTSPGTEVAYCSPPFWVLAAALERAAGQRFEDLLLTELLLPFGMRTTGFDTRPERPDRYVEARVGRPEHEHLPEQVRRLAYPAGGLIATVDDLLAAGQNLLGLRIGNADGPLAPATVRALWTPRTGGLPGSRTYEPCPWPTERGLGWALGGPGDLTAPETLWHSGGSGTAMWVDPIARAVVVLLTATWFLPSTILARIVNAALAASKTRDSVGLLTS